LILVPVKDFTSAKQRLADVISREQRRELAEAMLGDVLRALAAVPGSPRVALVTRDVEAKRVARQFGCEVIEDGMNIGETEAIAAASQVAVEGGARWTLVIPGDAPLVTSEEVARVLQIAPPEGTVLAAAADGEGTNAIFRRPATLFPLRFGNHSFHPHLRSAQATGKPVVVLELPGVALDIDRLADLLALAEAPGETAAQQLVRRWASMRPTLAAAD
jgi:2-phospho-L-lactate/phosphoenolpyruvate guanylyltransferase